MLLELDPTPLGLPRYFLQNRIVGTESQLNPAHAGRTAWTCHGG